MKRIVALMLALMLVLSLAACASEPATTPDAPATTDTPATSDTPADEPAEEPVEEPAEEPTEEPVDEPTEEPADEPVEEPAAPTVSLPLTTEDVVFTGWIGGEPRPAQENNLAIGDTPAFQWLKEKTGVAVDITTNARSTANEKFNLMLVSEDYTDFIYYNQSNYIGGMAKYMEDEIIVDLAPYMDEYAPNYQAIRNGDQSVRRATMLDDGEIPGFYRVLTQIQTSWMGPILRGDWMTEMGLESPKTLAEWEAVLAAFRDRADCEIPWAFSANGIDSTLASAYGFPSDSNQGIFYPIDGKITYRNVQDNFLEYLTVANRWYNEGLISKEFFGESYGWDSGELSKGAIGGTTSFHGMMDTVLNMSGIQFVGVQAPSVSENGLRTGSLTGSCSERVEAVLATITTSCENVPLLVQFMDFIYSEEGTTFANYGIEGETYTLDENGNPQFTDLVVNHESYGITDLQSFYGVYDIMGYHNDPTVQYATASQVKLDALAIWDSNIDRENEVVMPEAISMSAEEAEEYSSIISDINTLCDETIVRFITGEKPLSEFEDFCNTLWSMNLQTAIDLKQASYDRYMAR